MPKDLNDVIAAERQARQEAARQRAHGLEEAQQHPRRPDDARSLPRRVEAGVLERARTAEGHPAWFLGGHPLRVGDVVEVFTNSANGWLRGRFEWDGGAEDPPRIALNVWDPNGTRDEDGLPPWVGSLDARIPDGARVRRG